jgi:hypothetical protein
MCHTYGWGLVHYGVLNNDSVAIAEAEAIADIALTRVFGGTTSASYPPASGANMGYGGGRNRSRPAILVAYLAEATGKAKWINWRNALIDAYLGASTRQTVTTPDGTGSFYSSDDTWVINNGNLVNGYVGTSAVNYADGVAQIAAGVRLNASYQSAHHVYFLWLAYMSTGRADVRQRIIECARFYQYFAHDPAQTAQGGPFIGAFFGFRGPNGFWHREYPGAAQYDLIAVNPLVWGYKLTGNAAMLARAKIHMRNGTLYPEATPPNGSPQVANNQVWLFLDTHREHFGDTNDKHFAFNKGQLQYCYQLLENGGRPALV